MTTTPTTPDKSAPEKGMELLPCPFCESAEVEHWTISALYYGDRGYKPKSEQFTCKGCGVQMNVRGDEITKGQAFAKWNTRTPAQETGQQDAEKAEALLKEVRTFIKAMPVKIKDEHMVFADDANRLKRLLINVEAALSAEKNYVVEVTGETSDGYHTFNELYEHRHTLFAALLKCYPDKAWKSKLHDDGTMFEGWFIAGIETPDGSATYHIPLRLWRDFDAKELPQAPKWDGHTSNEVIERIGLLTPAPSSPREGVDVEELKRKVSAELEQNELDVGRVIDYLHAQGHLASQTSAPDAKKNK